MAVNTKAIKRRMKSVANTKKITKAMEMVSAAKMRRAVEAAVKTRAYATRAKELMAHLSVLDNAKMPLLEVRPVSRMLVVVMSSNRGLCGSFNSNLLKRAVLSLNNKNVMTTQGAADIDEVTAKNTVVVDMIGVGKKSAIIAKKTGVHLIGVYDTIGEKPSFEDLLPIAKAAITGFTEKTYDKVFVLFTDYRSSLTQEPTVRQVLPVTTGTVDALLAQIGSETAPPTEQPLVALDMSSVLFEPTANDVLNTVLPRLVEVQLYQALLESGASEHSARMVAMKNATEAAKDMLSSLQLSFNKARQAAITQEISEIVGGAAALE